MSTSSLKFCILSSYRIPKFTGCSWSISLLIQNIALKWTRIWCSVVLTLDTCLSIWSKFCFITSRLVTLSWGICWWTVCIISWRCSINYLVASCLVHLSWWYTYLDIWFSFALVCWCQIVIHLSNGLSKQNVFVILDNSIYSCWTTIIWLIINKVWIVFIGWKITKIHFFTRKRWVQSCISNFITSIFINKSNVNIWIIWTLSFVYWQSNIIISIVLLVIWFKVPNTKCHTVSTWICRITCWNACSFVCKCRSICIVHTWSYTYTCWKCVWSCNCIQLCRNCWCTIDSCVPFKTCCYQCCHHVIHWLAQSFALISIGLSSCIRICQLISCCQFWLNFSNSIIDCFFLLCILMVRRIFFCDFVQQGCFRSILFQDSLIIWCRNSFNYFRPRCCRCRCCRCRCLCSRFIKSFHHFFRVLLIQCCWFWGHCRSIHYSWCSNLILS